MSYSSEGIEFFEQFTWFTDYLRSQLLPEGACFYAVNATFMMTSSGPNVFRSSRFSWEIVNGGQGITEARELNVLSSLDPQPVAKLFFRAR